MKKLLSLVLVFSLLTLSACNNKQSNNEDNGNTNKQENTQSEKEPVTEEKKKDPVEAELNIMMSFPQFMDQWETYCKQYEDKILADENVKLKINLEMPSSSDYESVLQARLTGDDAPDLYTLHSNNIATYYEAGHLTDLSNEPLADKIYPDIAEMVTYDNKLLGVPLESQAWGVLYNKDVFSELNIELPQTLSDLENIVKTLEENDYTPFMLAFQEQWVPQLMTALTLGGKVSGEIPDWVDRMNSGDASYNEVAEIFNVIDLIMEHGTDRAMEEGSEAGAADFANGEAVMFVQGTWASGTIMDTNENMNLGVYALPINENPDCTRVNLSVSTTLAVHPSTNEEKISLGFANYVLDDEDSSELFKSCFFNPLASSHNFEAASWVEDASAYVEKGKSYKDLILPSAVTDEQGKLLQEYYVGSVSKEEIIERLDEVYAQAVNE